MSAILALGGLRPKTRKTFSASKYPLGNVFWKAPEGHGICGGLGSGAFLPKRVTWAAVCFLYLTSFLPSRSFVEQWFSLHCGTARVRCRLLLMHLVTQGARLRT